MKRIKIQTYNLSCVLQTSVVVFRELCGVSAVANLMQCVLALGSRVSGPDEAPLLLFDLGDIYPGLEPQGPLPEVLRRLVATYDMVRHEELKEPFLLLSSCLLLLLSSSLSSFFLFFFSFPFSSSLYIPFSFSSSCFSLTLSCLSLPPLYFPPLLILLIVPSSSRIAPSCLPHPFS